MVIKIRYGHAPILRGAKIATFLLSLIFVTVLTFGIFTRPTQAEFLNSVTCLLNIGDCTVPPTNTADPTPPPDQTPADTTPSTDTTKPTASVTATPNPAGGSSQVVTINGVLNDDTNLASYTISVNGNVAQQGSVSGTSANVSYEWNVSTPNVVPSGTYTITVDVTDVAGNHGDQAVTTVGIDNDPPAVTIGEGGIIKSGSITPDVTVTDAHDIASYQWTASESNPEILTYDASAMEPTFSPKVEGTYVFYLQVTDSLGNVSSGNEFTFGYKRDLETVPLPTTTDPTDELVDQSPSTVVPANTSPVVKVGRDEITTTDQPSVLGSTVTAAGQTPPTKTVATIAPTSGGWSIFGILWYWWLVIIGAVLAVWHFVKKFFTSRIVAEQS
ncbi:MAG: hypothetical protein JWO99_158 [Candidatus Saccharibacteria bacterium]|nr:hypothetical protein [Candidatus Saccharibacteria bacterium]